MLEEIELLDKAAVLENDLDNLAAGYAIKAPNATTPIFSRWSKKSPQKSRSPGSIESEAIGSVTGQIQPRPLWRHIPTRASAAASDPP